MTKLGQLATRQTVVDKLNRTSLPPGFNGDASDMACDHCLRYTGDIATMRDLGVAAYCFSVAWPGVHVLA